MSKLFNAFENFEQLKITKPIRLIELFAGVGAQAMALRDIGAKFEHYRVCEFDKYAIQSYNAIHGTSFPVSDIRNWKGNDLGIIDKDKYEYILTYSFPCQSLSSAGKQGGMIEGSGTSSSLLWEVKRLLTETEQLPQILLMENVTQVHSDKFMKEFNDWCDFLKSIGYTNKWKDLSATDYGIAQTRDRCFMISCLGKINYNFPDPVPLENVLIDYLEPYVDKSYYITNDFAKKLIKDIVEQHRLVIRDDIIPQVDSLRWIRTEKGKELRKDYESGKIHHGFNEYRTVVQRKDNVSNTITTVTKDNMLLELNKLDSNIAHIVGRNPYNPTSREKSDIYEQRLELKEKNKSGTLTTVWKDNVCLEKYVIDEKNFNSQGIVHNEFGICRTLIGSGGTGGYHSGNQPKVLQIYKVIGENRYIIAHSYSAYNKRIGKDENSFTLGTSCGSWYGATASDVLEIINTENSIFDLDCINDFIYDIDNKKYLILIRRLTELECWRLMGFSDFDYTAAKNSGVSKSQLYKQAGNSIVKQVLMAIFRSMNICQK